MAHAPKQVSSRQSSPVRPAQSCGPVMSAVWAGFRFLVKGHEKSFIANRVEAEDLARDRFAAMLRDPFPNKSDHEIASIWADRLQRSPRQVRNWLDLTHSASVTDIFIVGATLGVWKSAEIIVGERSRDSILEQIGQGK